jgi:uncharacterized protein YkwD
MIFLSLNRSTALSFKIKNYAIGLTFLLLATLGFSQDSSAQNIPLQPAARLVSDSVSEPAHSRPRKVSLVENSPLVTEMRATAFPSIDEATSIERTAFEKTNEARVENGRAPLVWDAELCRMAREHSQSMARQGYFSHETLEGLRLKDRARSMGIAHFRVIAENIAYNKGYDDPGAFAVERWMISAGHRANILYVDFQATAIGSYVATDGSVYLTQVFIAR